MISSPFWDEPRLPEFNHSPVSSAGHAMRASFGPKRPGSSVIVSLGRAFISASYAFPTLSSSIRSFFRATHNYTFCRRGFPHQRRACSVASNASPSREEDVYVFEIDLEDFEHYTIGGYHPTKIEDTFHRDRYQVVHKLGFGGYSTIWLARVKHLQRYVSLKILVAGDNPQPPSIYRRYSETLTVARNRVYSKQGCRRSFRVNCTTPYYVGGRHGLKGGEYSADRPLTPIFQR